MNRLMSVLHQLGRYWEIHPWCPRDFPRPERCPVLRKERIVKSNPSRRWFLIPANICRKGHCCLTFDSLQRKVARWFVWLGEVDGIWRRQDRQFQETRCGMPRRVNMESWPLNHCCRGLPAPTCENFQHQSWEMQAALSKVPVKCNVSCKAAVLLRFKLQILYSYGQQRSDLW